MIYQIIIVTLKKQIQTIEESIANTPGGDTIIVVYDTEQGDKPYLYNRIKFDNQYINAMRDDNIVIVYKIISYPDDDINM